MRLVRLRCVKINEILLMKGFRLDGIYKTTKVNSGSMMVHFKGPNGNQIKAWYKHSTFTSFEDCFEKVIHEI